MRSRYKFDEEFGVYFITSTVVEFIPIFLSGEYCKIIINAFDYYSIEKDFKIHAYVIMDNHFHAIISGESLSNKIKLLKMWTAREIIKKLKCDNKTYMLDLFAQKKKVYKSKSKYQIWQEGVYPKKIENSNVLEQKFDYIHNNPVKKGLVNFSEDWVYSSAGCYKNDVGVFEVDKIGEF